MPLQGSKCDIIRNILIREINSTSNDKCYHLNISLARIEGRRVVAHLDGVVRRNPKEAIKRIQIRDDCGLYQSLGRGNTIW